jgi:phospholipase C
MFRSVAARNVKRAALVGSFALLGTATACGGSNALPSAMRELSASLVAPARSPIRHVVIVIQENRSFNDFFATFPGADGTTIGKAARAPTCGIEKERTIKLKEHDLVFQSEGPEHGYQDYVTSRDGGKMDGFDLIARPNGLACRYLYMYTNPSQIKPYWDMAKQYVLAEHMFTTQGGPSFTAHQDLIAGGSVVAPNEALVNLPSALPWGCDAPHGTRTSLITKGDVVRLGQGPFPCLGYRTLRDVLDAKNVSWKYYVPPVYFRGGTVAGAYWDAFNAIKAVRYSREWKTNVSWPQTNIFEDVKKGRLPAVSWLVPDEPDSDHPGTGSDTGPSWVASVVNAIGESSEWKSTAIVILWDDWGGFYDNLNPKQLDYGGLGFRVPAIIVSPYAKRGYIAKTQYEFGSILRYIEDNWGLRRIGTSDERAASIIDCFDYSQKPRKFVKIAAKYPTAYFLNKPPSYLPVDTDM